MSHELYSASYNDTLLLKVSVELPAWAPRPRLNREWLRSMLALAVARFYRSK